MTTSTDLWTTWTFACPCDYFILSLIYLKFASTNTFFSRFLQDSIGDSGWGLVSEAADHYRVARMAGDRLAFRARDHGRRDAGSFRQRTGSRVRRGLPHRVLAPQAREMGPLQGRQGQ